jgi:zinc protease
MRWPTQTGKLALGYRAPALGDDDYPVLAMINELLFVGRGSRMFRRLLRCEELVSDMHASVAPFADPGLYEIWLSLRSGVKLRQALAAVDDELSKLTNEPVEQDELARVKNRVELAFLLGLETASGKAEQIGFYETVLGDAGRVFSRLEEYRAVTPAAVQRVAQQVFDVRRRTRVEVSP